MFALTLAGESVQLLPARAIYWPAQRTAFIADLHFGKAAAFASHGLPLPQNAIDSTTLRDLERLDQLLLACRAERLVILGDLLHAPAARQPEVFGAVAAWRSRHTQLAIDLIRGNHDRSAGDPPADWHITCHPPGLRAGPFALHHEPQEHAGAYALAGHIHPGVRLRGIAGDTAKAPCFVVGERRTILPAFGSFTGSVRLEFDGPDRLYAVGTENIFQVPQMGTSSTLSQRPARSARPAQTR